MASRRISKYFPPVPEPEPGQYERCIFDLLSRQRWRNYATLGDVLNDQLQKTGKVTRCSQTNWNWRTMAERWNHAKIILPMELNTQDTRSGSVSVESMVKDRMALTKLRSVRTNDKSVDTADLEYDPYNISSEYTHRSSSGYVKYIPPAMKDTMKTYGRRWKLYTAARITRRHKRVYPDSPEVSHTGYRLNPLPKVHTHKHTRIVYGKEFFNGLK